MRILRYTFQNRRDFNAIVECEGCHAQEELRGGYDDRYYHDHVMPERKCKTCDESRNSLGIKAAPTATRYAEWETV